MFKKTFSGQNKIWGVQTKCGGNCSEYTYTFQLKIFCVHS